MDPCEKLGVWSDLKWMAENLIIKHLPLCQMSYRRHSRISGYKTHFYHVVIPSGLDLQITFSISMSLISLNTTLVKLLFTDPVKVTLAAGGLFMLVNLRVNLHAVH